MRKSVAVLLATLTLCSCAAEQRPWYKSKKVWAAVGATAAVSIVNDHATTSCQKHAGTEQCLGGYAEPNGMRAFRESTQLTSLLISLWMRHDDDSAWLAPTVISNTAWTISSVRQYGRTCHGLVIAGQCQEVGDGR